MAWLLACCAVLAVALGGCTPGTDARPRLVVAALRQPATSLLFVAQGAGCFGRERLAIDERTFELGRDALALLRDGGADVAIAYETPLLRAALADGRLRVLTRLHTSTANTRLVSRAGAQIRGFADLRGKRLGLARGTNADFFAEVALAAGGVPRAATAAIALPPAESVAALQRGEIDAAVLSDPYAGLAEAALGPEARTLVTNLYAEASLLITRADVLETRRPALRALLRGLVCAEREARERPDEARRIVLSRFPEEPAAAVDAQLARVSWGLGLDNVLLDLLRRQRDWVAASIPGASAAELRSLVDVQLLEEVHPEAVTFLPGTGGLRW